MNNLAQKYAEVFKALDTRTVLSYMKVRGHLSLLPSVVRILERAPERAYVSLTIAREHDAKKFERSIADSLALLGSTSASPKTGHAGGEQPVTVIDPRIVGGYLVRFGSQVIDKSFRNALISLYKKTIHHV